MIFAVVVLTLVLFVSHDEINDKFRDRNQEMRVVNDPNPRLHVPVQKLPPELEERYGKEAERWGRDAERRPYDPDKW